MFKICSFDNSCICHLINPISIWVDFTKCINYSTSNTILARDQVFYILWCSMCNSASTWLGDENMRYLFTSGFMVR